MKITPLEIRQREFEKKLRGYDKDEVQAFLQSLSNEWERMIDENKEYKIKLAHAEKEVQKLREVESSLFKTLKTAEDTGANLVDQANKAAELHMKETQMKAEGLLNESKQKAKAIIEQSEQEAKDIINEVQEGVRELEHNHKKIEAHRDTLIKDLMTLAADLVERVEKTDKEKGDFKLEDQIKRVRALARESEKKIEAEHLESETKPLEPISVEQIQKEVADQKAEEVKQMDQSYGLSDNFEEEVEETREEPTSNAVEIQEAENSEQEEEIEEEVENQSVEPEPKPNQAQNSFFDLLDD